MPICKLPENAEAVREHALMQSAYAQAPTGAYLHSLVVAAGIGVVPSTLEQWRTRGTGPRYRRLAPNRIVYLKGDVEVWMAERDGLLDPSQPRGAAKRTAEAKAAAATAAKRGR